MKETYLCPICETPLKICKGGRNREDGFTLYCSSVDKCTSNETPIAWGRSEKNAYNILVYKYGPKDKRAQLSKEDDSEPIPEDTTPSKESNINKHISYE